MSKKEMKKPIQNHEFQFGEVLNITQTHQKKADSVVNEQMILTAWAVGEYVSNKLKNKAWGSKVVTELSEYICTKQPDLKGFGKRHIYNMVKFYDEYSSPSFYETVCRYLPKTMAQNQSVLIEDKSNTSKNQIIQQHVEQIQPTEIVQSLIAQLGKILSLTTFTNHLIILTNCKTYEERLFYILYANKERLSTRELRRCIENQTYSSLLSDKKSLSKGMLEAYPNANFLLKDTLFVDFLGLPQKHSESKLKKGLLEHMKEFILELGKDFIFMDQEYNLQVGSSTYKADLLFYHRGLQALVAVELKKTKFNPRDLGQLEFYLEALDRDVKRSNENPSIGILLCPSADKVVVEYAMSRSMSPTMIAEYKRILIPQEQMQRMLNEFCSFYEKEEKSTPRNLNP